MKKYNLSKIMKRAWELVKKSAMTISSSLKKAWEEAKRTMKCTEKQITWAKELMKKNEQRVFNCFRYGVRESESNI